MEKTILELIILAKSKGVTRKALALESGLAESTITRWHREGRKPHATGLSKFIEAYETLTKGKRVKKSVWKHYLMVVG